MYPYSTLLMGKTSWIWTTRTSPNLAGFDVTGSLEISREIAAVKRSKFQLTIELALSGLLQGTLTDGGPEWPRLANRHPLGLPARRKWTSAPIRTFEKAPMLPQTLDNQEPLLPLFVITRRAVQSAAGGSFFLLHSSSTNSSSFHVCTLPTSKIPIPNVRLVVFEPWIRHLRYFPYLYGILPSNNSFPWAIKTPLISC